MRMVTAKTGAFNPDVTWHYPVNLIWWCVSPQPTPFNPTKRTPTLTRHDTASWKSTSA
jgi:hypothetical protein